MNFMQGVGTLLAVGGWTLILFGAEQINPGLLKIVIGVPLMFVGFVLFFGGSMVEAAHDPEDEK